MALPQMPNIPGAAVMTDTLDFVKNLWGSMGVVPGIAAPTLSVDELDKKINDLKAVEAWLNLNSSMVRGSIQALEVQRNTIATLKSMGQTMASAMQQSPDKAPEKKLFESIPYASAFFQHAADVLTPAAPGAAPKTAATAAPTQAPTAPPTAAPAAQQATPQASADGAASDQAAAAAAAMATPAAWWNLLQDQFKQAVSTAMSPEAVSGAAARATEAATKFAQAATKPLAKTATAKTDADADAAKAPARKVTVRKAPAKKPAPKAGKG